MSWISYLPDHPFPIQNLPYGVFSDESNSEHRCCTTIGDTIIDLSQLAKAGVFADAAVTAALQKPVLNEFMSLGWNSWKATREVLTELFSVGNDKLKSDTALCAKALIPSNKVKLHLPAQIGDYTDFYASKEHATNLGKLFRPGQPALFENWLTIPIGYHGRASSIIVSGTNFHRPVGQKRPDPEKPSIVGACAALDIELEMGVYVGTGNEMGDRVSVTDARKAIFGYSVFNDWSARDIQKYEYVPLGPFAGKNFASTVSPWIISTFALEPFLVKGPEQDPAPLPYLKEELPGNYDVNLSVTLKTHEGESHVISNSNYKYMYWSAHQMLAHHTLGGCNMRPGDVMASGTISGPTPGSYGSMLEMSWQGKEPIKLPSGAERKMLQDGDSITLNGWCEGNGFRIGFGDCTSTILPAKL